MRKHHRLCFIHLLLLALLTGCSPTVTIDPISATEGQAIPVSLQIDKNNTTLYLSQSHMDSRQTWPISSSFINESGITAEGGNTYSGQLAAKSYGQYIAKASIKHNGLIYGAAGGTITSKSANFRVEPVFPNGCFSFPADTDGIQLVSVYITASGNLPAIDLADSCATLTHNAGSDWPWVPDVINPPSAGGTLSLSVNPTCLANYGGRQWGVFLKTEPLLENEGWADAIGVKYHVRNNIQIITRPVVSLYESGNYVTNTQPGFSTLDLDNGFRWHDVEFSISASDLENRQIGLVQLGLFANVYDSGGSPEVATFIDAICPILP